MSDNNSSELLLVGLKNVPILKELNINDNANIFSNLNKLSVEGIKKSMESERVTTLDILNIGGIFLNGIDEKKLSSFFELFPNVTSLGVSNNGLKTISVPLM